MKILIDSSYFLPLIKKGVENVSHTLLGNLLSKNFHDYSYSNLTLFKLTAKGLKISSQKNTITPQNIRIGIDTIQNDSSLRLINFTDNPLIIEKVYDLSKENFLTCQLFQKTCLQNQLPS